MPTPGVAVFWAPNVVGAPFWIPFNNKKGWPEALREEEGQVREDLGVWLSLRKTLRSLGVWLSGSESLQGRVPLFDHPRVDAKPRDGSLPKEKVWV